MKTHYSNKQKSLQHLMHSISLLANQDEALAFFSDLCTPAELEAMTDRWQVVPLLREGIPYRTIHEQTGVSVTTITRVARFLTMGNGGYTLIAERLGKT
jgi:TrpR-related protein YerC/YecD